MKIMFSTLVLAMLCNRATIYYMVNLPQET